MSTLGEPTGNNSPDSMRVDDPSSCFAGGPIRIGPKNVVFEPLLGVSVFLAIGWLLGLDWTGVYIVTGCMLLLGLVIFILSFPRREIILSVDGVEFVVGRKRVRCPWALFNVDGAPFISSSLILLSDVTLPVAPSSIPHVELWNEEYLEHQGAAVQTRDCAFVGSNQLKVKNWSAMRSEVLGNTLLTLGRSLGTQLPAWATRSANSPATQGVVEEPPAEGWVALNMTGLRFPPRCCGCGGEPTGEMDLEPHSAFDVLVSLLTLGQFHTFWMNLKVPICDACKKRHSRRNSAACAGIIPLLIAGGILGIWVSAELVKVQPWTGILIALTCIGFLGGFFALPILLNYLASPIRQAWYSRKSNTVAIQFRWPEYAKLVTEHQAQTTGNMSLSDNAST